MNRRSDISPLSPNVIGSTQFPNPFSNVVAESDGVPPSYRNSMPPISPYSQMAMTRRTVGSQNVPMTQPSLFSFDSLPPISPSSSSSLVARHDVALPPMSHRRSNSDMPFALKRELSCEKEEGKSHEEAMGELFTAYMNLDNIHDFNGSEKVEDFERQISDSKESGKKIGLKRRGGKEIASSSKHYRSVSMDSCFDEKSNIGEKASMVPPTDSVDGNENVFSLDFTESEMKKILGDEKLQGLAASEPKRVKRILANRESAARSKERKSQYITELENKVLTLQTEAVTMSAQFSSFQRDLMLMSNENKELRIRLQAMDEQAKIRDALNEQLIGEVRRLKVATGEERF